MLKKTVESLSKPFLEEMTPSKNNLKELNKQLLAACIIGDNCTIIQLLEQGADIDTHDGHYYALHLAVLNSRETTVQLLLEKGAEVDSLSLSKYQAGNNMTPLHLAAAFGLQNIAEILLVAGADYKALTTGATPCQGKTPARVAIEHDKPEMAHFIKHTVKQLKKTSEKIQRQQKLQIAEMQTMLERQQTMIEKLTSTVEQLRAQMQKQPSSNNILQEPDDSNKSNTPLIQKSIFTL